jgi:hypothetical protein
VALGDPVLGLTPAAGDAAARWGTVRVHGDSGELWFYGPQGVVWHRGNRTLSGAQALVPGDRLMVGPAAVDWDAGSKPGLT